MKMQLLLKFLELQVLAMGLEIEKRLDDGRRFNMKLIGIISQLEID